MDASRNPSWREKALNLPVNHQLEASDSDRGRKRQAEKPHKRNGLGGCEDSEREKGKRMTRTKGSKTERRLSKPDEPSSERPELCH